MSKQGWEEVICYSSVDGAAIVAAAATSMLPVASPAKKTLQSDFFDFLGQMWLVSAHGRISSVITAPGTMKFQVTLGGIAVFDSGLIVLDPVIAHVNEPWYLEILMTLRAVGTAANFFGVGRWTCYDITGTPATPPKGALTAMLPWNAAPAVGSNFDSTAAQQLDLIATPSVATGSIQLHQFYAQSLN